MALPFELYIRFLAPKGYDDLDEVNAFLEEDNLTPIEQADLDRHWALINNTLPKGVLSQIENKSYGGEDFLRWMAVLNVKELWQAEKPFATAEQRTLVKLARGINDDPQMRLAINCLAIKGVAPRDISQTIQAKFSSPLRDTHIEVYQKFFFDSRRMSRSDWRVYLHKFSDFEQRAYFTALTEPLDVVKNELDLPAKASVSQALQWLFSKSFQKAKILINTNTPEAGREARAWIDQVVTLADKYEKYRSADQSDFAQSLQLEFEFVESEFETPDSELLREVTERLKAKPAE